MEVVQGGGAAEGWREGAGGWRVEGGWREWRVDVCRLTCRST